MQRGSEVKVKVGIAPLWKSLWSAGGRGSDNHHFLWENFSALLHFSKCGFFFHIYTYVTALFVLNVILSLVFVVPQTDERMYLVSVKVNHQLVAILICLLVLSCRLFRSQCQSHSEFWVSAHTVCMRRHFFEQKQIL